MNEEPKRKFWSELKDILLIPRDMAVMAWLLPDMIFTMMYQEDYSRKKEEFFKKTLPKWVLTYATTAALIVGGSYYLATRSSNDPSKKPVEQNVKRPYQPARDIKR